ncbi:hypothetical protein PTKIN_Ptkin01aG0398000 [Pterospermum kingtungense]
MLEVVGCNFKELSPYEGDAGEEEDMIRTLPKIKNLISLASASSSFQNLTYLDAKGCKGMAELIVSSKAQSLGCLVTMIIRDCETMTEIVASEGADEATYEIIFRELKRLELDCLHSLKSFCSGNHTFKFPSLEKVCE